MWTIAVPTCDGARHLREALRGILAQEYKHFDILLIDDHSRDATVALAREVLGDRARVEVNAERLGLAGNWGRCLALCETPRVAIVHQDDVLRPEHLAVHAAAFERDPGLGMACSAATVIDDAGVPVPARVVEAGGLGARGRVFPPGALLDHLAVEDPLRCSAVTLSKAAIEFVGGFDPRLRYALDWDAWIRVARAFPVAWLAKPTVAVRWHSASETHRFKTGVADLDEQAVFLRGLHESDPARFGPNVRRLAHRRLARAYLNRAYDAAKAHDHVLKRSCLKAAFRLAPTVVWKGLADPRLAWRLLSRLGPVHASGRP